MSCIARSSSPSAFAFFRAGTCAAGAAADRQHRDTRRPRNRRPGGPRRTRQAAHECEHTAYDRTAAIDLVRGGDVLVCSTSQFHLSRSGKVLRFSLLSTAALSRSIALHRTQDVMMTPDLRMTFASAGPLDLRLRVTPNGDTCIEEAPGKSAPPISVSDELLGRVLPFAAGTARPV